jgi:hypothetical protein
MGENGWPDWRAVAEGISIYTSHARGVIIIQLSSIIVKSKLVMEKYGLNDMLLCLKALLFDR